MPHAPHKTGERVEVKGIDYLMRGIEDVIKSSLRGFDIDFNEDCDDENGYNLLIEVGEEDDKEKTTYKLTLEKVNN